MIRKHLNKLIPLGIALILAAAWSFFLRPQLEITARTEILKMINQRPEFKANFKELNLNVFMGKASVDLLKVEFLDPEIQKYVPSMTLDSLAVHLDLFKLAIGQFGISYIALNHANFSLHLDPLIDSPSSDPMQLPMQEIFKKLESIPLGAIQLNEADLTLVSQKYKFSVLLPSVDLVLSKRKSQLDLQTKLSKVSIVQNQNQNAQSPPLQISMHAVISPEQGEIKTCEIQGDFLTLMADGKLLDLKNLLFFPKSQFNIQSQINFNILAKSLPELPVLKELRQLHGQVSTQGQMSLIEKNRIQGRFDLEGTQLGFAEFYIGDFKALGQLRNDHVEISQLQLSQAAGQVQVSKASLSLDSPFHYSAAVSAKKIDTKQLFASLDLRKIPLDGSVEGDFKCDGQISPLRLECQAKGDVARLTVQDEPKDPPIVSIKDGHVDGSFTLDSTSFAYKAQLEIGSSKGTSSGNVDFENGFQIEASTDKALLADAGPISNLSLAGEAQLSSVIKGNAKTATFQIQANIKNFEFEKYRFGDVTGVISYEKGQMFFQQLKGKKEKSQYTGDLKIHFLNKYITGSVDFPTAELHDIQDLVSAHIPFPADIYGTGHLNVDFNGPLDLWKMDTLAQGQFYRIMVAGETFDHLDLLARGTKGTIAFEKFLLKKNQSQIVASGKILSSQEYQILVDGNQLKLEESAIIAKTNSNIFGSLSFATKISGQLTNPLLDLRGSITDTVLDDQELLPSRFNLTLDRDRFSTTFELLGQKVAGELQIPITKNVNNPLKIKLRMNKWAYGDLFAVFGNQLLMSDYKTLISGQVDLVTSSDASRTNYTQTDGIISIDHFLLQRGNEKLENEKPLSIELNSGHVKIKHFELKSADQQYILLPPQQFAFNNLDLNFQSELKFHLLHIFLPFLEDLGGNLTLRGKLAGTYISPEVYGNATINDGFVKLKGLSHPIERIQSNIEFSQSKMIVQQIKAQFAQGAMTGSGYMQILNTTPSAARTDGTLLIPLQIKLNISDMKLNVPDQVHTQGDAILVISGQSFPYLLSGDYIVKSGLVEKDFSQGQNTEDIKRNYYLPQQIVRKEIDPLNFDIRVLMDQGILVKNPLMDGSLSGRLTLKGSPQAPLLFGKITFDKSSQIIFKDKSFTLQNGIIEFNNPNEISPEVYVTAFTRVGEYDINLIAQGAAKDLNIKMTSVPPLSEPDVISLLALGVTSSTLEAQGSSSSQAKQTGYELGAAIFSQNPLNQKLKQKLGVNLQLSSSFDSTKNASVPKITATRKLSPKVNASVSRSVGTDETTAEVKLQYLINQNVSAIGSFENKEDTTNTGLTHESEQKSVLGIDIEYKREFK